MTALALIGRYLATVAPALSFRRPLELHVGMLLRSKRLGATYQIIAIHGDTVTVQLYRRPQPRNVPGAGEDDAAAGSREDGARR